MISHERYHSLLSASFSCPCGRTHGVPIREILVGPGVAGEVGALLRRLKLGPRALILADSITWGVAGAEIASSLQRSSFEIRRFILPGKRTKADMPTALLTAAAAEGGDSVVISVGSGTITDLAKWAAFQRRIPHVAVATAPSMNGYASGIVAFMEGGLKTTRAVAPPVAIVADTGILAAAPIEMIRAGLGDLLSKPVCNADWKLASILKGEHFCPRPFELIRDLEPLYLDGAAAIARREPEAIEALAHALILSGISMVIAGSSAPASGGEHLVSHFLDMRADLEGREHALHGAQVGVAAIATAKLWERILALEASDLDPAEFDSNWERGLQLAARLREIFGERASVILAEFEKKRPSREAVASEARLIRGRWEEIRASVRPFLMEPERIRAALDLSGAPVHHADLRVPPAAFREALEFSLLLRNRFTVLDLALAVGELEGWAQDIAAEARPRDFVR